MSEGYTDEEVKEIMAKRRSLRAGDSVRWPSFLFVLAVGLMGVAFGGGLVHMAWTAFVEDKVCLSLQSEHLGYDPD